MSTPLTAPHGDEALAARLALLERRARALTLSVALLAPTTATLALAAFRQSPAAPAAVPEEKRLVLRSDDGVTVIMEPTSDGGFRVRSGRVTEHREPAAPGPSYRLDGGELTMTTQGRGPTLELREPRGRTVARLGGAVMLPAVP